MRNLTEQDFQAVAAAIDSGDIETQCSMIPEGAPGRSHLIFAVRAARRVRECVVDATALASGGQLWEALDTVNEAARHLETMQAQLFRAAQS